MLFRPLRQIADKFNTLQMGMVAANRVFKILDTDEFVKDIGTNLDEIKGEIIFDKVNFSYEVNNPIIKNLSIEIKPGKRVAILVQLAQENQQSLNLF